MNQENDNYRYNMSVQIITNPNLYKLINIIMNIIVKT